MIQEPHDSPHIAVAENAAVAAAPQHYLWGVTIHSPLHLGYDKTLFYLKELVRKGHKLTVVLADLHSRFTNGLTMEEAALRASYYKTYFEACGLKAEFVRGSSFQNLPAYKALLMECMEQVTLAQLMNSLPMALRHQEHVPLSVTYMNMMQVIDPLFLGVDRVFGDCGQKPIYDLSETITGLQDCAYPAQDYMDNFCDIYGHKLMLSSAKSRLSLHDDDQNLREKAHRLFSYLASKDLERQDALLEYYRYSIFPWVSEPVQIMSKERRFVVQIEDFGKFEALYKADMLDLSSCAETFYMISKQRISVLLAQIPAEATRWINQERVVLSGRAA